MISEGRAIRHGAANIEYAMNKKMAEVIKINGLPEDIEPLAMWSRMMQLQRYFGKDIHSAHPIKDTALAFEISPTKEETRGWALADWQDFVEEWIEVFDSITRVPDKPKARLKPTNIKDSQYVAALHFDSDSGIMHVHLLANRVDNMGNTNDASFVGLRAAHTANIINYRRGWKQSADIHEEHLAKINRDCDEILRGMGHFNLDTYFHELEKRGYKVKRMKDKTGKVKAYSVFMGNSKFIASSLGHSRNLTVSRIENTWTKMHAGVKPTTPGKSTTNEVNATKTESQRATRPRLGSYTVNLDGKKYEVPISREAKQVLNAELEFPSDTEKSQMLHLMYIAVLLYGGYVDAATTIAESHGGGGSVGGGWGRDKDDDDRKWARKCAKMANWLFKPMRRTIRR